MFEIFIKNKKNHIPTFQDVYVGRGSPLGNPYTHRKNSKAKFVVSDRETAILKYKEYLLEEISKENVKILSEIQKIQNKLAKGNVNLVCYCSPKKCHAEVIKEIITEKIKNKKND